LGSRYFNSGQASDGIYTLREYNPSHIFQLKQKYLRRENRRIRIAVGGVEEKNGE
jgi:hypothetical protein